MKEAIKIFRDDYPDATINDLEKFVIGHHAIYYKNEQPTQEFFDWLAKSERLNLYEAALDQIKIFLKELKVPSELIEYGADELHELLSIPKHKIEKVIEGRPLESDYKYSNGEWRDMTEYLELLENWIMDLLNTI